MQTVLRAGGRLAADHAGREVFFERRCAEAETVLSLRRRGRARSRD